MNNAGHAAALCTYTVQYSAKSLGQLLIPVMFTAGKAWQTPLGRYAPQRMESVAEGAAWALVLQLPLEGLLSNGGGVHFVVKRGQGSHPEWLQGPDHRDFFIPLDQVTYIARGVAHQLSLDLPCVSSHSARTAGCASGVSQELTVKPCDCASGGDIWTPSRRLLLFLLPV